MAELQSLAGRVYAVTGASKGMGLRFARALAQEGAKVVLLARASDALTAAGGEIPEAMAVPCDIGRPDAVRAAFAAIRERHGRLHGLVNNAAACLLHKAEGSTDEEIRTEIDTNLAGPLFCIREAIPLLKAAGGGDIVNVSSESVHLPFPFLTLYAATKAGLEMLSQGLREELKPDGIRVSILRSGPVLETSLGAGWRPELIEEFTAITQGAGPIAAVTPETMAAMLVQMLRLPREAIIDIMELRPFG